LVAFAENDAEGQVRVAAFRRRLQELGWSEGHNLQIDFRYVGGDVERMRPAAAELVALTPDVIFVHSNPGVAALQQVNRTIPAVFAQIADPVGSGFVNNLAHPGGNITGLSNQQPDLAGKRLEVLRDIIPGFHQLAILTNANNPTAKLSLDEVLVAARKLGLEVIPLEVKSPDDIAPAIASLNGRAQALYVVGDPLTADNQIQINTLALAAHLPTMHGSRGYVDSGGLLSYGPNFSDLFRRAGDYVDKILKGAKPADLPVEEPTKIELVVNLKTAKAIGLDVPPSLLVRADEVIE
jgi:putative ABC transport system substrate-binding protein